MGSVAWLVLDVDDTLVATFEVALAKAGEVAGLMGLPAPGARRFAQLYGRMPFADCVLRLHPGVDVDTYTAHYDSLANTFPARPLADVPALLAVAARAGVQVGILTNGPGYKTERKLDALGVRAGDFTFVRHADNSAVRKPDSRAFAALLADFAIDAGSAWYVSDAPADWDSSAAAGFGTIAVTSGPPFRSAPAVAPDLVVHGVDALTALLPVLHRLGDRPRRHGPRPTAVSFDAGFTLIEHIRSAPEVVAGQLAAAGVRADPAELQHRFDDLAHVLADSARVWSSDQEIGAVLRTIYREVVERSAADPDGGLADAAIEEYTRASNWRLRDDAQLALRVAAWSHPVGILANWQSDLATVCEAVGIAGLVHAIVPSARAGVGKPAGGAFAAVAGALGRSPAELLHIGDDAVADAFGALHAGGRAVLIPVGAPAGALRKSLEVALS